MACCAQVIVIEGNDRTFLKRLFDCGCAALPGVPVHAVATIDEATARLGSCASTLIVFGRSLWMQRAPDNLRSLLSSDQMTGIVVITKEPCLQAWRALRAFKRVSLFEFGADDWSDFALVVRGAAAGRPYTSAGVLRTLSAATGAMPDRFLSEKLLGILCLSALGLGVGQISRTLGITVGTVASCRTKIAHRLSLDSQRDLSLFALEQGYTVYNADRSHSPGIAWLLDEKLRQLLSKAALLGGSRRCPKECQASRIPDSSILSV